MINLGVSFGGCVRMGICRQKMSRLSITRDSCVRTTNDDADVAWQNSFRRSELTVILTVIRSFCDVPDFFDMPASSQKSKFVVDDKVPSTWYNQTDWLVDLIVIVDYNVYRDCTSVQNLLP